MHKINYGGIEIADSEYRIGVWLFEQKPEEALNVHLRRAFEEYGELINPNSLLQKMRAYWRYYK